MEKKNCETNIKPHKFSKAPATIWYIWAGSPEADPAGYIPINSQTGQHF